MKADEVIETKLSIVGKQSCPLLGNKVVHCWETKFVMGFFFGFLKLAAQWAFCQTVRDYKDCMTLMHRHI